MGRGFKQLLLLALYLEARRYRPSLTIHEHRRGGEAKERESWLYTWEDAASVPLISGKLPHLAGAQRKGVPKRPFLKSLGFLKTSIVIVLGNVTSQSSFSQLSNPASSPLQSSRQFQHCRMCPNSCLSPRPVKPSPLPCCSSGVCPHPASGFHLLGVTGILSFLGLSHLGPSLPLA